MIFDVDDLWEGHDRLDLLCDLKAANPLFKATAFAVPGLGSVDYWNSLPEWLELGAHGWTHPHAREAEEWSYEQSLDVLLVVPVRFADVWKSPGWQISDGTYQALQELGWAVADQPYNDHRRPAGLRCHRLGDGDHVHTHVQNVEGNGLDETFQYLLERVTKAESFEFISEVATPWEPPVGLSLASTSGVRLS